jgi:cytochrome P450
MSLMMDIGSDVYYDPYDVTIYRDPYPVFRRLREEAPLYFNERFDFFALSRYDEIERALVDRESYSLSRGASLDQIKSGVQFPPGSLIFEDPPLHTSRRSMLSRVFTPKRMNGLEPSIREYCAQCLDPLVGAGRLDFMLDLGNKMPMRMIGLLLGIPEQDQDAIKAWADGTLESKPGEPWEVPEDLIDGAVFADYVEWRTKHPSDDLMTDLLEAEFEDETGTRRRLTRGEVLTYINVLAVAGNETTGRLIGWIGKLLGDHPDQRQLLVRDPSLGANAIEEILRYEPPGLAAARYVVSDVEHYGKIVPAGSALLLLLGSANRDERRFPHGDRFDVTRSITQHLTFGFGIHFCLGASLARAEGRIALEEILTRFPDWEIDAANATMATTTTVRGWQTLPAITC